jgi:hypothetical protein
MTFTASTALHNARDSRPLCWLWLLVAPTASAIALTSSVNVRILEPAFVDTSRQFNYFPMAIGVVILLLGLAVEFYTLRPPLAEARISESIA